MAIAFDSALAEQDNAGGTGPFTYSFTNTAGNLVLIAFTSTAGDVAGTISYGGVTAIQWQKRTAAHLGWQMYIYAVVAAPTGSNTVSIGYTGSTGIRALTVSYSGYGGSTVPDATSQGDPPNATSMTGSITSVQDNAWQYMMAFGNNTINPTSGCTARGGAGNPAGFDSNAAKHPAGTVSFVVNSGGTLSDWSYLMVSFGVSSVYNVVTTVGTFAITGNSINVNRSIHIVIAVGTFVVTGINVVINRSIHIAVTVGSFIITGISIIIGLFGLPRWKDGTKNSASWENADKNTANWDDQDKTLSPL